mmetsp:Transcript_769/g.2080  ORF Transcript_769/g.2080 Transcript_769/m.2080 type:complete len:343 (+) Transcript_769:307-1335(+)
MGVPDEQAAGTDWHPLPLLQKWIVPWEQALARALCAVDLLAKMQVRVGPASQSAVRVWHAEEAPILAAAVVQCEDGLHVQAIVATVGLDILQPPGEAGGMARERIHIPVQPLTAGRRLPLRLVHKFLRLGVGGRHSHPARRPHRARPTHVHQQLLCAKDGREGSMHSLVLSVPAELRRKHKGVPQDAELGERGPALPGPRIRTGERGHLPLHERPQLVNTPLTRIGREHVPNDHESMLRKERADPIGVGQVEGGREALLVQRQLKGLVLIPLSAVVLRCEYLVQVGLLRGKVLHPHALQHEGHLEGSLLVCQRSCFTVNFRDFWRPRRVFVHVLATLCDPAS